MQTYLALSPLAHSLKQSIIDFEQSIDTRCLAAEEFESVISIPEVFFTLKEADLSDFIGTMKSTKRIKMMSH